MKEWILPMRWGKAVLIFGFWTLIGLFFAGQFYLSSPLFGRPVSWAQSLHYALGDWYVWGFLSVFILRLSRFMRVEKGNWLRAIPTHLVLGAVFSVLYVVIRSWLGQWQNWVLGETVLFVDAFRPLFAKTFIPNLLIYSVIVTVSHAVEYYKRFHEREKRSLELERHLTQAKLKSLQMQLNPHFLFNTLHAISSLMHQDVEAADRMIARLSDLLRYALESTDAHEVSLGQEVDFLRRYLEIEQARFGKRLSVEWDIAPETLQAQVPNLVLQPIVENAIRHGIEPHAKAGRILLQARREEGVLRLRVRDNGAGLPGGLAPEEGVGLSNTRSRLQQLYGARHEFVLANAEEGGMVATVSLPFREQPALAQPISASL